MTKDDLEAARKKEGHSGSTIRDRKEDWKEKSKWNNMKSLKRITGKKIHMDNKQKKKKVADICITTVPKEDFLKGWKVIFKDVRIYQELKKSLDWKHCFPAFKKLKHNNQHKDISY